MSDQLQRTLPPFPSEANWPPTFIPQTVIFDLRDYSLPGWIRQPYAGYIRKELPKIRESKNKIGEMIKVVIVFASQAIGHAPDPLDEIVKFVGWLSIRHRHANKEHVWHHDLQFGFQVVPTAEFLRALYAAAGWKRVVAMYGGRLQRQSAAPREIEELLQESPTPEKPPKKRTRNRHQVDRDKLRNLRGSISQDGLAEECQVSEITIRRGEAGGRWADKTFVAVAKGLSDILNQKITPNDLKAEES